MIFEPPGLDFGGRRTRFRKVWGNCFKLSGYFGHAKWEKDFLPLVSLMGIAQVPLRKPKSGKRVAKI